MRPQLLQKCLDSLGALNVPSDVTLNLVVVDNEPVPNNEAIVTAFAASCPFAVHYVHQPVRGIAVARNAILDKAEQLGADWIAMIDDDETAHPDWIAGLMATEYRRAPVLRGRRVFVYPDPVPFWLRRKDRELLPEGRVANLVSTCNVRFSADLVRAGLRFDESLGLCGGEDRRFFDQATEAGFQALCTNKALTYEVIPPVRTTYRYQLSRRYAEVAGMTTNRIKTHGRKVVLAKMHMLLAYIPLGIMEIAVSPLAGLYGASRFRNFALRGGHRLAFVAGNFSALFGRLPEHYRHIAGN